MYESKLKQLTRVRTIMKSLGVKVAARYARKRGISLESVIYLLHEEHKRKGWVRI